MKIDMNLGINNEGTLKEHVSSRIPCTDECILFLEQKVELPRYLIQHHLRYFSDSCVQSEMFSTLYSILTRYAQVTTSIYLSASTSQRD